MKVLTNDEASILVPLFFLLIVGSAEEAVVNQGRPRLEVVSAKEISAEELIGQLGAADFKTRNRAEQQLVAMGEKAVSALERDAKSDDPEIKVRVANILGKLSSVFVRRFLENKGKCTGYAEEVESNSRWPCIIWIKEFDKETGAFKGEAEWTSLNGVNVIEGKLSGGKLEFRETGFVRRGDAILNVGYTFDLRSDENQNRKKIHGRWHLPGSSRGGYTQLEFGEGT